MFSTKCFHLYLELLSPWGPTHPEAWVCSRLPGFLPHVQIVYALTLSISRREMGAVGDLVRLYTITHLTPGNISCHGQATVFSLHTRIGLSCQWRLHQFSGDWQVYKCPSSIYKKLSLGFAFISRSVTLTVSFFLQDFIAGFHTRFFR